MNRLGYAVALLAALGLTLGVGLHAIAWFGATPPSRDVITPLMLGVFAVWMPTVLQLRQIAGGTRQRGAWKLPFIGAPRWMRRAAVGCFGYAIANFGLTFLFPGGGDDRQAVRIATGHAMAFYGIAMAAMYAAARRQELGIRWRCANGHRVSPTAQFCEECGVPVPRVLVAE